MGKRIGRRAFLRDAALGAVTGTSGLVILRNARSARAYAANARPNAAVIGCGGRGSVFTHGYEYAGGRQYTLVAMCDVNEKKATKAYEAHPDVPRFHDYRKMLDDKHREIDCVFVVVPDQSHAPASACAMEHGKHTYCEKGLTSTVYEARVLRRLAEKHKLATQMGNQGSSSGAQRRGIELVQDGAIGEVREAYIWSGGGSNRRSRPEGAQKIPHYLKWDLWLGPTASREFNAKWMAWSSWRCFATGSLGLWGSHSGYLAWNALRIRSLWDRAPEDKPRIRVSARVSEINRISHPKWAICDLQVPARGDMPPVTVTWLSGDVGRDRITAHLKRFVPDWGEAQLKEFFGWGTGAAIIGEKGILHANPHNTKIRLIPEDRFQGVNMTRPERIPRARGGHAGDWLASCRDGRYTLSDFRNSGPYWEFMTLCRIADLFDGELEYDPLACRITNNAEADALIHYKYREGWPAALDRFAEKKPPAGQEAGDSTKGGQT